MTENFSDFRALDAEEDLLTVDQTLLTMVRELKSSKYDIELPGVLSHVENLLAALKAAYARFEPGQIDQFARHLFNFALIIGAQKMMRFTYLLQNAARCRDALSVSKLLEKLENEFMAVRAQFV
ncbi:MAG: hypothetical protein AB7T49_00390 [Oligoflexales bacterium]